MQRRTLRTAVALHARPLDRFVRLAREVGSRVQVCHGGKNADGKNVVQLLLLAVPAGAEITLVVEGADEQQERRELEALVELLTSIGEEPEPPPQTQDQGAAGLEPASPPEGDGPIRGIPGASGVGIGLACREPSLELASRSARGGDAQAEQQRFDRALRDAAEATGSLINEDDPFADIFRAQRTIVDDPELRAQIVARIGEGAPAEGAVAAVFSDLERRFSSLGSEFATQRYADVADVRDRILEALGAGDLLGDAPEGRIVWILREATPSRMATFDRDRVAAVISLRGGPTSHAAIVARARGIPLVFAVEPLVAPIRDQERLRVDGSTGSIEREYAGDEPAPRAAAPEEEEPAPEPARTADGCRIRLRANLGAPGDLELARRLGCDGCGVLRTELLFAGRQEPPPVAEQARAYRRVAEALAPGPVVVRLFDAGSDKPLPFLPGRQEPEPNPALGLRGVQLLLRHPQVVADQLEAITLARNEGGLDVRAMVPMVVDIGEVEQVRDLFPDTDARADCPLGVMIETPAAALLAGSLIASGSVSFVSIGTNDLTQYVLAVDREDQDRATLARGLHPAVLRLITQVARTAAASGVECSVCGEQAGDPAVAPLLVGSGVHALSMSPGQIPAVRAAVRAWSMDRLEKLAEQAASAERAREVNAVLDRLKGG
jgi:phosphoenolpyruvate-protein phosphotransferase